MIYHMVSEATRIIATWSVITVPFLFITTYLWYQNSLSYRFAIAYWTLPIVVTFIGILPHPWGLLT